MPQPPLEDTSENASASFWQVVIAAIRGEHRDYTTETLNRAVVLLAIPMVLEMVMESIFALADVFWVSHLGSDAVAVVGITESIMTVIYAVAIGLSMAGTATVARRIGEKDPDRAATSAFQVILLGLLVSATLGLVGGSFGPDILRSMGGNEHVVSMGGSFSRIMLGGNATVLLIFVINAIFRGAGDAAIAMRTLWLAYAINILLGPCLVFGLGPFPALGVTGAAVATNIGRGCGVLYQLFYLTARTSRVRIQMRHLHFELGPALQMLKLAANGTIQNLVNTASWIGLVKILSQSGSAALAGYTIAIRVVIFAILPAWGLSNAGATLVGQNLGAKQPDRAETSVWRTGFYNMLFLGGVGVILIMFAEPAVRLFTHDPEVIPLAASCLRILSYGNIGYAYGMVMLQAFNGAGDTITPTWVNLFGFWFLEIPLAYWLAIPMNLRSKGVFFSIVIAEGSIALAGILLFRRGRWKQQKI